MIQWFRCFAWLSCCYGGAYTCHLNFVGHGMTRKTCWWFYWCWSSCFFGDYMFTNTIFLAAMMRAVINLVTFLIIAELTDETCYDRAGMCINCWYDWYKRHTVLFEQSSQYMFVACEVHRIASSRTFSNAAQRRKDESHHFAVCR